MRKKIGFFFIILVLAILSACDDGELPELKVDFEIPETIEVGETLELKAVVTYDEEMVEDADEVDFEYWEGPDQDNSTYIDSTNNGDGTYTAEVTFDHDGVFSIYAHTTARDLHTMPKREVTVGEGAKYDEPENDDDSAEGFSMNFEEPENVVVDQEAELITTLQMDQEPFTDAEVRYEIWNDDVSEKHDWIDVEELESGEYAAVHTFSETGIYTIQIHVEDDDGLHEHEEYDVEVTN